MEPTLQVGDYVLMQNHSRFQDLRGHIVAFYDPLGGELASTKRVVADQNSEVVLRMGRLYVNGAEEPEPGEQIVGVPNARWTVGENEVFVVGDNRNYSHDSIQYGPVKKSSILGVLTYCYWPLQRHGPLER